jgi:hypothetical protein
LGYKNIVSTAKYCKSYIVVKLLLTGGICRGSVFAKKCNAYFLAKIPKPVIARNAAK